MAPANIDPLRGTRVAAVDELAYVLDSCRAHAHDLGCRTELASARLLAERTGAARQRALAKRHPLPKVLAGLADDFVPDSTLPGLAPLGGGLRDSHLDPSP